MIDKQFASKQIARMASLDRFPKGEKEAINELTLALQCASSEQKAEAFISTWVTHERIAPLPVDIRQAMFTADHDDEYHSKPNRCPLCDGTGWRSYTVKKRALPGMAEALYDFAAPCSCRKTS